MIDFLGSVMPEEAFMNRACLHEATVADEEKPWPRRSVGLKAGVMHLNTRGAPQFMTQKSSQTNGPKILASMNCQPIARHKTGQPNASNYSQSV